MKQLRYPISYRNVEDKEKLKALIAKYKIDNNIKQTNMGAINILILAMELMVNDN